MVRYLAGFDPVRCLAVAHWPLREALLAYLELLKGAAREDFRHQQLIYAMAAPYAKKGTEPPRVPAILRPNGGQLVHLSDG